MSLDDFTDTSVATLLMLASGAINGDLAATAEETVVEYGAAYPATPEIVGQQNLPLLAIHRRQEQVRDTSRWTRNSESLFRVEYWGPVTARDRLADRQALLTHVANSMLWAFQMGRHESVSSGAEVLNAAGLRYMRKETDRVYYEPSAATSGDGVYPYLRADLTFAECHATTDALVDVDGLDDFLRLRTDYDLFECLVTLPTPDGPILDTDGNPILDTDGAGIRSASS